MTKPKAAKKVVTWHDDDAQTRRWCVDAAIRWPTHSGYGMQYVQTVGGYQPSADVDLIARAQRIYDWVTK